MKAILTLLRFITNAEENPNWEFYIGRIKDLIPFGIWIKIRVLDKHGTVFN